MAEDEKTVANTKSGRDRSNANLRMWKKGESGNPTGRPKSARQILDEEFLKALCADFKAGGVEAISKCREEKPDVYLNVIAKVLPKQVDVKADHSLADLAQGLHAVADFLSGFAAEEGGADHAGVAAKRPVLPAGVRSQAH